MKKEVLNLGKLLIKELELESSVDTLSRWMAHYIAQLMVEIENATETEKEAKEAKCFETILKLWKHMKYYKTVNSPFENFEPIFQTLNRLNPDNEEPFFFQESYSTRGKLNKSEDNPVKQHMAIATKVDEIARIWLEFIFKRTAEQAADEKTKEWINAAAPLADDDETSLIVRLLSNHYIDENDEVDNNGAVELIKQRIEQLKSFREFSEELILMYEEELKAALDAN